MVARPAQYHRATTRAPWLLVLERLALYDGWTDGAIASALSRLGPDAIQSLKDLDCLGSEPQAIGTEVRSLIGEPSGIPWTENQVRYYRRQIIKERGLYRLRLYDHTIRAAMAAQQLAASAGWAHLAPLTPAEIDILVALRQFAPLTSRQIEGMTGRYIRKAATGENPLTRLLRRGLVLIGSRDKRKPKYALTRLATELPTRETRIDCMMA